MKAFKSGAIQAARTANKEINISNWLNKNRLTEEDSNLYLTEEDTGKMIISEDEN